MSSIMCFAWETGFFTDGDDIIFPKHVPDYIGWSVQWKFTFQDRDHTRHQLAEIQHAISMEGDEEDRFCGLPNWWPLAGPLKMPSDASSLSDEKIPIDFEFICAWFGWVGVFFEKKTDKRHQFLSRLHPKVKFSPGPVNWTNQSLSLQMSDSCHHFAFWRNSCSPFLFEKQCIMVCQWVWDKFWGSFY